MNELKPKDVMRALERVASKANCNNMRYLEGCGHFCIRLGKNVDDMAKGRSPECNENCKHFAPPHIEEILRAALALLREKDAEIERLTTENGILQKRLDEAETNIELLEDAVGDVSDDEVEQLEKLMTITRAEAITEFAEKLKDAVKYIPWIDYPPVHNCIDQIAKEMKGETDGKSDL